MTDLFTKNARLRAGLERWQSYGCPDCSGDCGSANPPMPCCIMQETADALATPAAGAFHRERPVSGVMEGRGGKVIDPFGRVVLTVNVNDLSIDESRQVMDIILGALADAGY